MPESRHDGTLSIPRFVGEFWKSEQVIEGSCLCGAVAYECGDLLTPIGLCHCRTCQKAHASGAVATARVARFDFQWKTGADLVAGFMSTPGKTRWFCPKCGTHLMAEWSDQDQVILRVGAVDTKLSERPKVHIWMSHSNHSLEAATGTPEFAEGIPAPLDD
ncbi:GFA family protein [Sphingopyxis sp.]|uniref:GFA family protein n=1 Tax=Sphingopyxis sp. TaxID=1908224 RepID=UPI002B4753C3|nr:GFA family protein [Sphingopyxis sp.]HJS10000.1 GFA family protein [Sphingopyxis sp.]